MLQLSGNESVRLKVLINDVASLTGVDQKDHEARQQLRAAITDAIDASDTYILSRVKGVESVVRQDAVSESAGTMPESRRSRDKAPLDDQQLGDVVELVMQSFASQDRTQGPRRSASLYTELRPQLDSMEVSKEAFQWTMRQALQAGLLVTPAARNRHERPKKVSDFRLAVGSTGSAVKDAIRAGRVDDARALIDKAFEPEENA